jgi:hypothetical protein
LRKKINFSRPFTAISAARAIFGLRPLKLRLAAALALRYKQHPVPIPKLTMLRMLTMRGACLPNWVYYFIFIGFWHQK